jgi:hypothetical protein
MFPKCEDAVKQLSFSLKNLTLSALWLLALVVVLYPPARANSHKEANPLGERLILYAESVCRNFSPEERADLLLDFLDTPAGYSAENGKKWSLELSAISKNQLRPGPYRSAIQKNALIGLTKMDVSEAVRLFRDQDTPEMWTQEGRVEDYRARVARALFRKLWEKSGMSSVRKVKEFADWMGSTGEYPYVAMISVVQAVAQIDKAKAEGLISDAIGYYEMNPKFLDKHREFTAFITGVADLARPSLLAKAIRAEIDALEAEKKNADPDQMKCTIQLKNSQGTVQFREAEYIVYRLLPLINRLDPEWVSETKDKYEILKYVPAQSAGGEAASRVTGVVFSSETSSPDPQVSAAMDDHRLLQVTQLADSDPSQAAEIAEAIQDPGRRAIAHVTLIWAYRGNTSEKAAVWGDEANRELDHVPAGKVKLRLMGVLATSALSEGKLDGALAMFGQAFDLGELLFDEDLNENPGKMAYTVEGEEELVSLVARFSEERRGVPGVLAKINGVRSDLLKAKLLIAGAKGALSQSVYPETP